MLAGLYAIYRGLPLARDLTIEDLVCYSDSLLCFNLIKDLIYHVYVVLIQDIKGLISQSDVTLCHTLKEENQCADFLVKLVATSEADVSIHATPLEGMLDLIRHHLSETSFLAIFIFLLLHRVCLSR
jgi:ribonuclease HI